MVYKDFQSRWGYFWLHLFLDETTTEGQWYTNLSYISLMLNVCIQRQSCCYHHDVKQWSWHQWHMRLGIGDHHCDVNDDQFITSMIMTSIIPQYSLLRYGILKGDHHCDVNDDQRITSMIMTSLIMTSMIMTSMTPPAQIWDPQPNCCSCRCHQWQAWSQGLQSWLWWCWLWCRW